MLKTSEISSGRNLTSTSLWKKVYRLPVLRVFAAEYKYR